MRALGAIALACFAAHAIDILVHHDAANLLWSCNVGAATAALGLLVRRPLLVATGAVMLILGEPLWLIDLSTGGEWMWTSPLTHVGVLAVALIGARRLGVPRSTWAWSTAAIGAATAAARLLGPPDDNINLAFALPRGWAWFPSHRLYMVCLGTTIGLSAIAAQLVLRAFGFPLPLRDLVRRVR